MLLKFMKSEQIDQYKYDAIVPNWNLAQTFTISFVNGEFFQVSPSVHTLQLSGADQWELTAAICEEIAKLKNSYARESMHGCACGGQCGKDENYIEWNQAEHHAEPGERK